MNTLSDEQTQHSWKNKRKRSLYVEEGYAGFIFYRKSKAPRGREETGDRNTVPLHEVENVDIEDAPAEPEDETADNESTPLSEEQLERLIEVRSFVDQVKGELQSKGLDIPSDKLVEMCRELQEELRGGAIAGSGPYIQYLEASVEEKTLPPHPLDSHLTESITQLQQKIQLCEREVGEWDSLVEEKKRESQEATHDLESNLSVDWSQLRPEDEAKLATHLTQEQRDWLEHATSQREDAEWEKHTEEDLTTVSSLIDAELERIQSYCDSVLQQCAVDTSKLIAGSITQTETPRTLFRAFKDTH